MSRINFTKKQEKVSRISAFTTANENGFTTTSEEQNENSFSFFPSAVGGNVQRAFTLVELLTAVFIITLLSGLVLVSLSGARNESQRKSAETQLDIVLPAVEMMLADTGDWPGGCEPSESSNTTVNLQEADAGLTQKPAVGIVDGSDPCEWTAAEVADWNGPYINASKLIDPWGNPFRFDSGWVDYGNCGRGSIAGMYSMGPDGTVYTSDTCDNIYIQLGP